MENPIHRMRDIEDMGEETVERLNKDNLVPTHTSTRASQRRQNRIGSAPPSGDSYIPGGEKIFVRTWGCGHNNSDGEYMAGMLAQYGYGDKPSICANRVCIQFFLFNRSVLGSFTISSMMIRNTGTQSQTMMRPQTCGSSIVAL